MRRQIYNSILSFVWFGTGVWLLFSGPVTSNFVAFLVCLALSEIVQQRGAV